MAQKYYVVWEGRETGVFDDWASCKRQVEKFAGARYKSFPNQAQAEAAFKEGAGSASGKKSASAGKNAPRKNTVKTYNAEEISGLDFDTMIYTDGGCEPNPGEAGSGMAIYKGGEVSELWYGLYNPQGTNNTAELNALYQAMMVAEDEISASRSVAILCDSKYSIQCITQWAAGWEKRGWTRAGGEIKNLSLIQSMYSLYQSLKDDLKILHVNGHVGVEGNELADRMSIMAIAENATDFIRYPDAINIDEILALRAG